MCEDIVLLKRTDGFWFFSPTSNNQDNSSKTYTVQAKILFGQVKQRANAISRVSFAQFEKLLVSANAMTNGKKATDYAFQFLGEVGIILEKDLKSTNRGI